MPLNPCEVSMITTQTKVKINKQDDLPRHTYTVIGSVTHLISSRVAFLPFAVLVRRDLESDLQKYEIVDHTTLKNLHNTLLFLDILEGNLISAQERLAIVGQLEDKEAVRLMNHLEIESHTAIMMELGSDQGDEDYQRAFTRYYRDKISRLTWSLIGDEVKKRKAQAEMFTKNCLLGLVDQYLQPMVDSHDTLNRSGAAMAVSFYFAFEKQIKVNEILISLLQEYIDKHREEKPNIWPARAVDLRHYSSQGHPIGIGIWDAGVDISLFEEYIDKGIKNPPYIAYDMHWNSTTGWLAPMEGATRSIEELQADFKGYFDLVSALDTDQAQTIRRKISTLTKEDIKSFFEDFSRYAGYSHGTHVSGIAIEGNPKARLITVRLSSDPHMIPHAPSVEEALRAAKAFKEIVEFFKRHRVRVVNMSWALCRSSFEHGLEVNCIESSPEERKLKAREIFDIFKKGLFDAISSSQDILFIGGAGNSNNDITFDEFIPPMFNLPNLLIAGAVDQAGDPTSFTSFGHTVNVYANGFEVESLVPGGEHMKLSGTSMAAPHVTNLAAKLLSINPQLTPKEVISLIVEGCEEQTRNGLKVRIIHPKRSVELLTQRSLSMD